MAAQARDAGLDATVAADGTLFVEGRRHVVPPRLTARSPAFMEWSDCVLVSAAGEIMRQHLFRAFGGTRVALKVRRVARGLVMLHDEHRAAFVTPHSAIVADHETVHADFLRDGRRWAVLRWRVEDWLGVARGPEPLWLDALPTVVTEPPGTVSATALKAAVDASRRLKEDRTLVFAHAVTLFLGESTLRFLPLTEPPAPLEAPFVFTRGRDRVEGGLRLKSPNDVLACAVSAATDQALILQGWFTALLAYAALTCVEIHSQPRPTDARATTLRADASSGESARPSGAPRSAAAGGGLLSADFVPRGRTREYLAAYVVGHRRRLRPNQRHSDEAVRAAMTVGIQLKKNETWVRPHTRGVRDDVDLQFTWRPPMSITE